MSYQQDQECIDACLLCASVCNNCASSCLKEEDVKMMSRCVQLDMECAVICYAAAQLMSLGSDQAKEICRLCALLCRKCAEECAHHSHMEHCKVCAEACNACADACEKMAA